MWEIDISLQAVYFLRSLALGGIFCFLYDILRSIRRVFSFSDIRVAFQDFIYFLIITPATFLFLIAATNGEIRFYVIFGISLGFYIFRLIFSSLIVVVIKSVISFLIGIFRYIFHCLFKIFHKFHDFISEKIKKNKKL